MDKHQLLIGSLKTFTELIDTNLKWVYEEFKKIDTSRHMTLKQIVLEFKVEEGLVRGWEKSKKITPIKKDNKKYYPRLDVLKLYKNGILILDEKYKNELVIKAKELDVNNEPTPKVKKKRKKYLKP